MKRRVFNLAAALSLMLCLATVALWVRSYWVRDDVMYRSVNVWSVIGQCRFVTASPRTGFRWEMDTNVPRKEDYSHYAAFSFERDGGRPHLCVPHWFVACLFAAVPTAWVSLYARRRHLLACGRCAACGYDLRATPERCPECGAAPHAPTAVAAVTR